MDVATAYDDYSICLRFVKLCRNVTGIRRKSAAFFVENLVLFYVADMQNYANSVEI